MIEYFVANIPEEVMSWTGGVFGSGREAFSFDSAEKLYIIGINPGGSGGIDVSSHVNYVLDRSANWSIYRDEIWGDPAKHKPGTQGIQPSILHVLNTLDLDPGRVPSSNLVFGQSPTTSEYKGNINTAKEICWPFHEAVIRSLKPKVILCMGGDVGWFVRFKTGALETASKAAALPGYESHWSGAYRGQLMGNDLTVVSAWHPTYRPWYGDRWDPTPLVREAL